MKRISWYVLGAFAAAVTAVVLLVVYLAFAKGALYARWFFLNHILVLFVGIVLAAILVVWLHRKMPWELLALYVVVPCVVAASWPDLVFFIGYYFQHGSFEKLLWTRGEVYSLMHNYFSALSAAPLIVGLVVWYEKKVEPLPETVWYLPLVLLVVTALASVLNVFLDLRFGL